jgi:hypothetical protein
MNTLQPYRPNIGKQHARMLTEITLEMNAGALSHWSDIDTLRRIIESAWLKTFPGKSLPDGLPRKLRVLDIE